MHEDVEDDFNINFLFSQQFFQKKVTIFEIKTFYTITSQ